MQKRSIVQREINAVNSARAGLLRGVSATELVNDPLIAWEHVVAAQTELAMSPDMGHSSTKAADFVGKATDYLPDRRVKPSMKLSDGINSIEVSDIDPQQARELLRAIRTEIQNRG